MIKPWLSSWADRLISTVSGRLLSTCTFSPYAPLQNCASHLHGPFIKGWSCMEQHSLLLCTRHTCICCILCFLDTLYLAFFSCFIVWGVKKTPDTQWLKGQFAVKLEPTHEVPSHGVSRQKMRSISHCLPLHSSLSALVISHPSTNSS